MMFCWTRGPAFVFLWFVCLDVLGCTLHLGILGWSDLTQSMPGSIAGVLRIDHDRQVQHRPVSDPCVLPALELYVHADFEACQPIGWLFLLQQ
mmetsp:Transcript_41175/g.68472  ORF Transcript_41175/g.68472 Transcript_41175/m.68472 type:complete len:93 (-) Transcript_41175:128-406(-)